MHVMKKLIKRLLEIANRDIQFSEAEQWSIIAALFAGALLFMTIALVVALPIINMSRVLGG